MAAPMLIYRNGGGAVIPGIISFIKGPNRKESSRFNRKFIPIKAVYFLLWSGMVSLLPFLPVYMSYVGLNPLQVGIARGIEPFIGMFSSPICGSLADKFSMHRVIMISSIIGTGLVYGSAVFVPLIDADRSMNWTNISHTSQWGDYQERETIPVDLQKIKQAFNIFCYECFWNHTEDTSLYDFRIDGYLNTYSATEHDILELDEYKSIVACCLSCNHKLKDETLIHYEVDVIQKLCDTAKVSSNTINHNQPSDFLIPQRTQRTKSHVHENSDKELKGSRERDTTLVFVLMLVIVLTGQFVSNPAVPLLDAGTMALCKDSTDRGQEVDYGHQRLWGGLAWGVFAPLAGLGVDTYSSAYPDSFNKYLPAFVAFVAVVLLSVLPALCIRFLPHQPPESLVNNLGVLIRRPRVLVFLYAMFITGVSVGVMSTYVFLFIAELHGSHTIMGLTLTLTCVAEVPFMFFATKLIERLGHRGVFVLTLFCYALRFVGYSLLQNPWLVLPIELLHGVTYGALWPACTSYINLITPDNMVTTMQSVEYGVTRGLGEGLGTLLGGVFYHMYGARNLFRGSAVLCVATLIFYWPMSIYLDKRDQVRERQIQYEEI